MCRKALYRIEEQNNPIQDQEPLRTLPDRKHYVRASRQGEKEERSQHIIESAEAVLNEFGFEKFTLDRVAAQAGFSRGGIYKYFRTKEDLFLVLHIKHITAWTDRLLRRTKPGMTDQAFVKAFLDTALDDPLYLPILRRYESMVNENASDEFLKSWWQSYNDNAKRAVGHISTCLSLDWEATGEALWSISAMMIGVSVMQSGQRGMSLGRASKRGRRTSHNQLRELFLVSAQTILRGLRHK